MRPLLTIVVCGLFSLWGQAQTAPPSACDSVVVVSGVVGDVHGRWIPSSMVVNRRSSAGEFVGSDGEFLMRACVGDTLVFGAVGYHTQERRVGSGDAMNVVLRAVSYTHLTLPTKRIV